MLDRNVEIFSRVSPTDRGIGRLEIFGPDQAVFSEDKQRPAIMVESDEGVFNCIWISRIRTSLAVARVMRFWEKPIQWQSRGKGFETTVDGVWLVYEGDQSDHPWAPRFVCQAGSLPVQPLSRLIASTSMNRQLRRSDLIEGMIRNFVALAEPVTY